MQYNEHMNLGPDPKKLSSALIDQANEKLMPQLPGLVDHAVDGLGKLLIGRTLTVVSWWPVKVRID